jgi:hypothetical protein
MNGHVNLKVELVLFRVNSLLAIKKTCDSLLVIKNSNFPIAH